MAAYCSTAERCPSDIERKLSSAGLPSDAIERIVFELESQNFINESRYARSFTADKLRFNAWGRIRIAYELQRKKISSKIIEEALATIAPHEYKTILARLLSSKLKTIRGNSDHEIREKLFRFAAGRGFEYDIIKECIGELNI
jgi:regulatory protein